MEKKKNDENKLYNEYEKNLYECMEDSYTDNYEIQTKLCKRLSREFGIEEIELNDDLRPPPEKHGLENSDVIIPNYYKLHKHPSKIFDFDFYEVIKDDIRNCRKLSSYQLEYIKNLKESYKDELIVLFNECIGTFVELLNCV